MKHSPWHRHPGVRTGSQLTFGERAADRLKAAFGSWAFLIILNVFIVGWVVLNAVLPHADRWDVYPFILLNLGLSWLAAQQGGALQIAANRGDRISAEVALHTQGNTDRLMQVNQQQLDILTRLDGLTEQVSGLAQTVRGVMAAQATEQVPVTFHATGITDEQAAALAAKVAEAVRATQPAGRPSRVKAPKAAAGKDAP